MTFDITTTIEYFRLFSAGLVVLTNSVKRRLFLLSFWIAWNTQHLLIFYRAYRHAGLLFIFTG